MIKNPKIAKQISELMHDMFSRLDDSCRTVKEHCSAEEYAAYVRGTSGIVGAIVLDVMEPLYKMNPDLKPANWDDDEKKPV